MLPVRQVRFFVSCEMHNPRHINPKSKQGARGTQSKPLYKLKFEDDDDEERLVSAQLVVEWPGI